MRNIIIFAIVLLIVGEGCEEDYFGPPSESRLFVTINQQPEGGEYVQVLSCRFTGNLADMNNQDSEVDPISFHAQWRNSQGICSSTWFTFNSPGPVT